MPVRHRKRKRKENELSEDMRFDLESGFTLFGDPAFEDEDDRRKLWKTFRETIMGEWVRERPGSRPDGWWSFEASEPRRLLSGRLEPLNDRLHQGTPAQFYPEETPIVYESETAYLDRLDLLSEEEKSLLGGSWERERTILKEKGEESNFRYRLEQC